MTLENFTTLIKENIEETLEEKESCKINHVLKNNGTQLVGISILHQDVNISPTIYLNNFYDSYENGDISMEEILNEILYIHRNNCFDKSVDLREFLDYEKIKDRIVFKIINTDKNEKFLEDVPHVDILDLSMVFQCMVCQAEKENATILIHEAHKKIWNVTDEELYEQAMKNTPVLQKYEMKNMRDVLCEFLKEKDEEMFELLMGAPMPYPMYVLSNRGRINGAGCLFYPNLMKNFAKAINSSYYIIPSSVHELILLPRFGMESAQDIRDMIQTVNDTELSNEEILSYSLYHYDMEEDRLEIVD